MKNKVWMERFPVAKYRCRNILQPDRDRAVIHLIIWIIYIIIKGLEYMQEFSTPKSNFSTAITWRVGEFLLKGFFAEPFEF